VHELPVVQVHRTKMDGDRRIMGGEESDGYASGAHPERDGSFRSDDAAMIVDYACRFQGFSSISKTWSTAAV